MHVNEKDILIYQNNECEWGWTGNGISYNIVYRVIIELLKGADGKRLVAAIGYRMLRNP